jgi:hypothetical protein
MMDTEDARNMQSLVTNKFWILDASSWLFCTKLITMHGHLNINYTVLCSNAVWHVTTCTTALANTNTNSKGHN